jgi:hypothetical protein
MLSPTSRVAHSCLRFVSADVWVESVMQQLRVFKDDMHELALSITYGLLPLLTMSVRMLMLHVLYADSEPGVGPGPLKEFFEMCLSLFSILPITNSTTNAPINEGMSPTLPRNEGMSPTTPPNEGMSLTPSPNEGLSPTPPPNDGLSLAPPPNDSIHSAGSNRMESPGSPAPLLQELQSSPPSETIASLGNTSIDDLREQTEELPGGDSYVSCYSTLFPLFQPCGEAYPDAVIPRPFQYFGIQKLY